MGGLSVVFDAIIVTTVPSEIPASLSKQLTDGIHVVIPVRGSNKTQNLCYMQRYSNNF
ncbi:hypothetical protein [Candidatus Profftia lariciata]|uniref:hypothetical protein n=1 Tax=Candidatus Profftia lariciata TaxID=1987921 RepID=UPI003B968584